MDVSVSPDEADADGEVVWSWHPDADAKSVGDDLADDGGNQARSPGSAKDTVKTVAQGMPDDPAGPVVTAACVFCLQAGRGRGRRPAFPAPSHFQRDRIFAKPGREAPREC
jgi:hypothetical protein